MRAIFLIRDVFWKPSALLFYAASLLLALLYPQALHAGINACKLADGSTVFQDSPCQIVPKATTTNKARQSRKIPFGIHASWFEKPSHAPDRAFCNPRGCDCGEFKRQFKYGLAQAVADAMYMDGNWHRHHSVDERLSNIGSNSSKRYDLQKEAEEAACDILMSQNVLKQYAPDVLADLRKQKRSAEDLGLDNPDDCDGSDSPVCDAINAIMLYERLQIDLRVLRTTDKSELLNTGLLKTNADDF